MQTKKRVENVVSFDWALKKLLRSKANFNILEGFLSELIQEGVTILHIADSESNKNHGLDKHNRVDIKVVNDKGAIILIELQHDHDPSYFYRILYGTSKVISEEIFSGDDYNQITRVISISILYFELGQGADYVYHGQNKFVGRYTHDVLQLTEAQQKKYDIDSVHQIFPEYYLLRLNRFDELAKDSLSEWIYFLKYSTIKPEFKAKGLPEAKKVLDILKLTPDELSVYEKERFDANWDAKAAKETIEVARIEGEIKGLEKGERLGLEKGERLGLEKGERLGLEKGERLGLEKGEQLGLEKGKLETAQAMYAKGLPIALIMEVTGCDKTQIESLAIKK